jgi:hypothetical protein
MRSHPVLYRAIRSLIVLYPSTVLIGLITLGRCQAQQFVNGNFESGTTGWSGCITEINAASVYGGVGSNRVAEVDGNGTVGTSDDRILCQNIPGFTVGSVYRITFKATRRNNASTPSTVSVNMTMDGGALNRTITRTGGFNLVTESYDFTATQTTHAFRVTPNFISSLGMIFDDLSLSQVSVLPVELMWFTAQDKEGSVELSWSTASETDNAFFAVERSANATDFEEVARLPGAVTSNVVSTYTVDDPFPLPGLSYYRLRQVDLDMTETHSRVVSVTVEHPTSDELHLFPNPSDGKSVWLAVPITHADVPATCSIIDMAGRTVLTQGVPSRASRVELNELQQLRPGMYIVVLRSATDTRTGRLRIEG